MPSNPKPKRKNSAERGFQKMSPELRTRCEKIRKLLAESGRKHTKARYQLGVLVNEIQVDPEKYVKRAVKQLAAALGYKEKTLYPYGAVASCWSPEELNELLEKKAVTGLPIISRTCC
jgi:hypothetical protein